MPIIINLETTGLDSKNDEIIEISLVKFNLKNFKVIDRYTSLINPGINIPDIITNITDISNDNVINSPYFEDIRYKVIEFIGDDILLGHNNSFINSFLLKKGVLIENNIFIDTFLLSNILFFDSNSLSLDNLADNYKFTDNILENKPLNKIYKTLDLFKYQLNIIDKLDLKKKQTLKYILSRSYDKGFNYLFLNYFDDIDNIDKTIFFKNILSLMPKYKKSKIPKQKEKNDFNFNSIIDKINNFEIRENQIIMSNIIDESLNKNYKTVIEAPTGVGKTFAYLIPSIIYSINNNTQVFISTSTKALQDQIFYKDIKFLSEKIDFTYSKLKGKSNYFGIYSFIKFIEDEAFFDRYKTSFLGKIVLWLFDTKSFELDEIEFFTKEYFFRNEINSDNLLTFSNKNLYSNREPLVIQRKKAKESNIVIVNNNILFQDIDSKGSILGTVKNLILDEAHNLEDVITNSLKKSLSINDLEKNIEQIKKILEKNKLQINNFDNLIDSIFFNIDNLFSIFKNYLFSKVENKKNSKILLKQDFFNDYIGDIDINTYILSIMSTIIGIKDAFSFLQDDIYIELNKQLNYLQNFYNCLDILKDEKKLSESIVILNNNLNKFFIEFTLLNVGDYISKNLWKKLDTCVLTSATLKTNNDFGYLTKVLKLDNFKFFSLDSDFNYNKQALLYIPNDLGYIKNNLDEIKKFLETFILITKGNILALFTSFYTIKDIYSEIGGKLNNNNINIYAQIINGGKQKLIDGFLKNPNNSIIFGTDTFWEGIDIPGNDLKYLIIYKIPFIVPDDPIFQARSVLYKNSFNDYSIPKAILKLKQGFGRLIRTKTDSGVIIFLDDRIYSTSWGKFILSAFPNNIKYKIGSSINLFNVLKNFKK